MLKSLRDTQPPLLFVLMAPEVQDKPRLERFDTPLDFRVPRLSADTELGGDPIARSLDSVCGPCHYESPDQEFRNRGIADHLGNDRSSRLALVEMLAESIPPLKPECRLSVCIPVAAHEEENHIRKALEAFRSQTAARDTWEIVLYLNHPFADAQGNSILPDATVQEVEEFIAENSDMNIHCFYLPIPREFATIGQVRRILHDVVALRYLMRNSAAEDHYMLRTDADILSAAPKLIQEYIERLDAVPTLSGVAGSLSHSIEAQRANPALCFGGMLVEALVDYEQRETLHAFSAGANLAFRLSAYVRYGGFNVQRKMGEDVEFDEGLQETQLFFKRYMPKFGDKLNMLGIQRIGDAADLVVSARRAQKSSEAGNATIEQWSRTETAFGTNNHAIRRWMDPSVSPGPEILDDPTLPARLLVELNNTINFFTRDRTYRGFCKIVEVLEKELGLVLEQENLYPIDFDTLREPRVARVDIKNMDQLLARLKAQLFDPQALQQITEDAQAAVGSLG